MSSHMCDLQCFKDSQYYIEAVRMLRRGSGLISPDYNALSSVIMSVYSTTGLSFICMKILLSCKAGGKNIYHTSPLLKRHAPASKLLFYKVKVKALINKVIL